VERKNEKWEEGKREREVDEGKGKRERKDGSGKAERGRRESLWLRWPYKCLWSLSCGRAPSPTGHFS
jgi:hypothetical protein